MRFGGDWIPRVYFFDAMSPFFGILKSEISNDDDDDDDDDTGDEVLRPKWLNFF